MSKFGDFLEAIYHPAARFKTVRAVISHRQDRSLFEQALAQAVGRNWAPPEPASVGQAVQIWETDIRVWANGTDRIRVEKIRSQGTAVESSLTIMSGDRWWHRDFQGHIEVGGSQPGQSGPSLAEVKRHFFASFLRECLALLLLEPLELVRTAARECVRVRATPRPGRSVWPHWLPTGADEYELHADQERGVVLYIAGRFRGKEFETNTVREVVFDENLNPALFSYEQQAGEQLIPAQPVIERLTLTAAIASLPLKVLIPTWLPDPDHATFEVVVHNPRVASDFGPWLQLLYRTGGLLLSQRSEPFPLLEGQEWQHVERGGRQMLLSDSGVGRRFIRLEYLGTHVEIRADLDREQLIRLAASLAPAG